MLACARQEPGTLFVGIDTATDALRTAAQRAARKLARGGAANAVFVAGAAEELPGPLTCFADSLTVLLPWGSLLASVVDVDGLRGLRAVARPGAGLEVVVSYDPARDGAAWERLGIDPCLAESGAWTRSAALAGWDRAAVTEIGAAELKALGTTWASKLAIAPARRSWRLAARAP